jgi:hypothetical protein
MKKERLRCHELKTLASTTFPFMPGLSQITLSVKAAENLPSCRYKNSRIRESRRLLQPFAINYTQYSAAEQIPESVFILVILSTLNIQQTVNFPDRTTFNALAGHNTDGNAWPQQLRSHAPFMRYHKISSLKQTMICSSPILCYILTSLRTWK